jgi:hypothetical protein
MYENIIYKRKCQAGRPLDSEGKVLARDMDYGGYKAEVARLDKILAGTWKGKRAVNLTEQIIRCILLKRKGYYQNFN